MRLSDAELARRVRERNMTANRQRRERLVTAGRVQLGGLWIPLATRERLDAYAAWKAMQLSDVVALALDKLTLTVEPQPNYQPPALVRPRTPELSPVSFDTPAFSIAPASIESENAPPLSVDAVGRQDRPLNAFSSDPNSVVNGGAVRPEKHTRPAPFVSTHEAMMMQIAAMLDTEMSGADIARELGLQGFKAGNGSPLRGANVLKAYRQWCEKHELNTDGELKR
jgi:hypothetical protein